MQMLENCRRTEFSGRQEIILTRVSVKDRLDIQQLDPSREDHGTRSDLDFYPKATRLEPGVTFFDIFFTFYSRM
jgi:hypothetical protein